MGNKSELYSKIPAVDQLLLLPAIKNLCAVNPEQYVSKCVRKAVEEVRQGIIDGVITQEKDFPDSEELVIRVEYLVREWLGHKLMRAINGAGVILHTGLGRAPLAPAAQAALMEAANRVRLKMWRKRLPASERQQAILDVDGTIAQTTGECKEAANRYCILATERASGKRGDRNRHTAEMLREITGAEDSLIVNNNSAAVILALNTFGQNKESIVSRGELVEIGGAFRIPDVMRRSGTIMVEVGTTNKTHLRDYRKAVSDESAVLLKVHTSNYRIEGFHQEASIRELRSLADECGLSIIHDIGSGAMVDLVRWGLTYEPTVPQAVADGADVITFSGDKLLGGPQAGVIVGRGELIDRMKRNPLMRAFRCDKLTISALDGTLKLFLDPDRLPETHPIYHMMTESLEIVNRRARRIARRIRDVSRDQMDVVVKDGFTEMGSGALPARPIPSRIVSLTAHNLSAERLALSLRLSDPPLFTRIEEGRVIIDARTIPDEEVKFFSSIFAECNGDRFDPAKWSNRAMSAELNIPKAGDDKLPAVG